MNLPTASLPIHFNGTKPGDTTPGTKPTIEGGEGARAFVQQCDGIIQFLVGMTGLLPFSTTGMSAKVLHAYAKSVAWTIRTMESAVQEDGALDAGARIELSAKLDEQAEDLDDLADTFSLAADEDGSIAALVLSECA